MNLRLKWHYHNNIRAFGPNYFKSQSKFNLPKNDVATELYLTVCKETSEFGFF